MFRLFRVYREIAKITKLANDLNYQNNGKDKKWSFFLTNRSFIVPALGIVLNILIILNLPLLYPMIGFIEEISPEIIGTHITMFITLITVVWSFLERTFGKTRVVWNKKQSIEAVVEAVNHKDNPDVLTNLLRQAGALK